MTTPFLPFYREIPLTRGQVAIVDPEDYDFLMQFKWHAIKERRGNFYACRHAGVKIEMMHRVICQTPADKITDHINRDTLDNRRANLRAVTASENQHNRRISRNNTSGFLNVRKKGNKWAYRFQRFGKTVQRQGFSTAKEAYDALQKIAPDCTMGG